MLQLVHLQHAGALADALSGHHKGDRPVKYDCESLAQALRALERHMSRVHDGYPESTASRVVAPDRKRAQLTLAAYDAEPELWDDLLHAARAVVDSWSTGDLAGAVRELAACVVALDDEA